MLKFILLVAITSLPGLAGANQGTKVSRDLFLKNLAIQVQSYVTNSEGTQILEVHGSQQTIRFVFQPDKNVKVSQTWTTDVEGLPPVNLTYDLIIEDNLSIHIDVAQFETISPKPSGLIRKSTFPIKDFGSVSWVAKVTADKSVVVRFTPILPTNLEPEALKYPVMALTDAIVIDNADRLWSRGVSGAGAVVALGSPYGRIFFSFVPFAGSKEIGYSLGDEIQLVIGPKKVIWIRSRDAFVGGGVRAKVYGLVQENFKEPSHIHSVTAMPLENVAKEITRSAQ